jgi:hypothetical protein
MDAGRLEGLIPLAGGVVAYLIYFGVIPMKDADTFKRRFGTVIKIAAPICIAFGLLRLLGVLR